MGIFALPEVEHPTRIGPQFVVTGIKRVLQHEHAVGRTVFHLQLLPFHGITVRREKLHIENLAQVGQRAPVRARDIAFVPNGIAEEIAGVVQMEIRLFLRQAHSETFHLAVKGIETFKLPKVRVLGIGLQSDPAHHH